MSGLHRGGKKISKSHSTVIDAALGIIDFCSKVKEIEKIGLGTIKQIGVGTPRIKFLDLSGSLKMIIRGRVTMQDFYLYTKYPEQVKAILTERFASMHR
jgi:hypothetical protein